MNPNPENEFKKFLIIILVVAFTIICMNIRPDLQRAFRQNKVLRLSMQKPWQENIDDKKIDDVDIDFTSPKDEFKEDEDSDDSFDMDFSQKDAEDEFWVTGSIPIVPMSDLNGKSKIMILAQRKLYVESTIFKNRNYRPSMEVFGMIDDKKPWLGIEALTCKGKGPSAYLGLSEESRYLNNPTMLVGLDRVNFDEKPKNLCSPVDYLMPVKINYSKDDNMIKVVFEVSQYKGELGRNFLLKGLNAKDLGFKYAYADKIDNVVFIKQDGNISDDVYEFKDFIHVGFACGVKGGCNNGSPYQKELQYSVINYPAEIHLKLWKKLPKNKNAEGDINYLIILK
ncbi:MAG: hypothetical protein ACI37S_08050 [Candidatus Gastranaerophilaceae bacterium]